MSAIQANWSVDLDTLRQGAGHLYVGRRMRKIAEAEVPLISWLLSAAGRNESVENLTVSEMEDGGMGSLFFRPTREKRRFGAVIADCQFLDKDGITVIATLNTDEEGHLFELDMWRTDFNPLMAWPKTSDITINPAIKSITHAAYRIDTELK